MIDPPDAWPSQIRLTDSGTRLHVDFESGESFTYCAEFLRVESPSAEVRGHGPGQETTLGGKSSVAITAIEPVGNYAVKLIFSDGHDTGLYSWETLYEYGHNQNAMWRRYLEKLAEKGLTR